MDITLPPPPSHGEEPQQHHSYMVFLNVVHNSLYLASEVAMQCMCVCGGGGGVPFLTCTFPPPHAAAGPPQGMSAESDAEMTFLLQVVLCGGHQHRRGICVCVL